MSDRKANDAGRAGTASPEAERSLFGEILDWMLAPLLFVWPLSIAFTHYFANNVANFPYDQSLRELVATLSRQVQYVDNEPVVALHASTRALLRADEIDSVYFHVVDESRKLLVGDRELPIPEGTGKGNLVPGEVYFRDIEFNGQELRIAYSYLLDPQLPD
ncbi:MAG TPA: sensor histidine kinase N-terminal domain-containing protein, partial [Azonexus sp.]|nr:sensor histidine kinase N-terminal domain-containing protein [Azonexus sp.]